MKKIVLSILILSMIFALFSFAPVVSAETNPPHDTKAGIAIFTEKLNVPISDENMVDYYINIKAPEKFASYDKILVVEQNGKLVIKIGNASPFVEDIKFNVEPDMPHELHSITIENTGKNTGFIFLNYRIGSTAFENIIYRYEERTSIEDWVKPVGINGTFGEYISFVKGEAVDPNDPDIVALNSGVSNICYANNAIYVIENTTKSIMKIKSGSISKLAVPEVGSWVITSAQSFAINKNEDIFLYGVQGKSEILKKNGAKPDAVFESVATINDIIDMKAVGSYLYLLTPNRLMKVSSNDVTKDVYTTPFNMENEAKSFSVSEINGENFVSFAQVGNDNISTYREVTRDKDLTLEYFNHYGANCTCETPHQGWFNGPIELVPTADESTIYVVDNSGKRLVVMHKTRSSNNRLYYRQYFFNASTFGIENIDKIGLDRNNTLYIASGSHIYSYINKGDYTKDSVTLTRNGEIQGFDGNIVDMEFSNKNKSIAYVLTDKNSVYSYHEEMREPVLIATWNEHIDAIYPSYDDTRIYIALGNKVNSYAIADTNIGSPITSLDVRNTVTNLVVDFAGSVFASTIDNEILTYKKFSDNEYKLTQVFNAGINKWERLSTFFVQPKTMQLYIADANLHYIERYAGTGLWGYINDSEDGEVSVTYDGSGKLNTVAKTSNSARVYTSRTIFGGSSANKTFRINYEMYRTVPANTYFYILDEAKESKDMYVVVDSNNVFGYIKKADLEAKIAPTEVSTIGTSFVPLFSTTHIYRYPFDKADVIDTITTEMTFINNVAIDNGENVWQNANTKWFKVSYKSMDGVELQGYVKMNEITKNASISAPSTKIHLRVTTKAGETAKMYDMPDIASGVIQDGIINGTLVRLMQEEFDKESEFTLVELTLDDGTTKVGYMLTANLMENKFTTLQVVAIIVTVITVLITILVIVLVVEYRKKKNNINTFKNDEEIK